MSTFSNSTLPYDVLELVFKEAKELTPPLESGKLRLVCKGVNAIVEPLLFKTLIIRFRYYKPDDIREILTAIIDGTSPFARWAKRVTIRPDAKKRFQYMKDTPSEEVRVRLEVIQEELLLPAIRALKLKIEQADLYCETASLTAEILGILVSCPLLRDLEVSGPCTRQGFIHVLPSPATSKLRQLKLAMIWTAADFATISFENLFRRSEVNDSRSLDSEEHGRACADSIQALAVTYPGIQLTGSSVRPHLLALSALQLRKEISVVTSSFWKALTNEGVHLQSLDMGGLDLDSLGYLLSYPGLQSIKLKHWYKRRDDESAEQCREMRQRIRSTFLTQGLGKHSATLIEFQIQYRTYYLDEWCWTKETLEAFGRCKLLQRLDVVCYFPAANETPNSELSILPLDTTLRYLIEALPNLDTLTIRLHYDHAPRARVEVGESRGFYSALVLNSALFIVLETEVTLPSQSGPPPELLLERIPLRAVESESGAGTYRYQLELKPWWDGELSDAAQDRMELVARAGM